MVSASTLGFRTEISFRSPGGSRALSRSGFAVAHQPQDHGCEWLLLGLAEGNIKVAGSNIGVEALTTQLVIQRCLNHPGFKIASWGRRRAIRTSRSAEQPGQDLLAGHRPAAAPVLA
jgi:hypothetical protein